VQHISCWHPSGTITIRDRVQEAIRPDEMRFRILIEQNAWEPELEKAFGQKEATMEER
jgi:hypothetical protein